MKKLLIFFLPAILLGCDSPAYRNPLDVAFGDPFILHAADGKFYMHVIWTKTHRKELQTKLRETS